MVREPPCHGQRRTWTVQGAAATLQTAVALMSLQTLAPPSRTADNPHELRPRQRPWPGRHRARPWASPSQRHSWMTASPSPLARPPRTSTLPNHQVRAYRWRLQGPPCMQGPRVACLQQMDKFLTMHVPRLRLLFTFAALYMCGLLRCMGYSCALLFLCQPCSGCFPNIFGLLSPLFVTTCSDSDAAGS